MSEIAIDLDDEQTLQLWAAVGDLVERLPGQWVLIGGLAASMELNAPCGRAWQRAGQHVGALPPGVSGWTSTRALSAPHALSPVGL